MMSVDDKAKAAYYRELADVNERHGVPDAAYYRRRADELDPPKPEYPVGTIAWTRSRHNAAAALRFLGDDGSWRISATSMRFDSSEFESIEVIPTLPEGYVAIPDDFSASPREHVDIHPPHCPVQRAIVNAYADALEAKDNQ